MKYIIASLSLLGLIACSDHSTQSKSWNMQSVEERQESIPKADGNISNYIVFVFHLDCPDSYPQGLHIFDTGVLNPKGELDPYVSISFGVTEKKEEKKMEIFVYVPKEQLKGDLLHQFTAAFSADGFETLRFSKQIEKKKS